MIPINDVVRTKKGGGLLGKIFGGVAGAIAAPFTGGASIPAGIQLGGMIGEAVKPTEATQARGPSLLESASKASPKVQMETLRNTALDILDAPLAQPEKEELLNSYINPALEALKRNDSLRTRFV